MNKRIWLEVKKYENKFIKKCIDNQISLYDVKYFKDHLEVLIDVKDYRKIKKLNYYSKIRVFKYDGFLSLKYLIKQNLFYILVVALSFIWVNYLSNYVLDVQVIHQNSRIRKLVSEELKNHGIKKYTLGYSFETLDKITKEILKDNPNTLEWLSITKDGMKYIIRAEERIIIAPKTEDEPRDIIALKDAYITKVVSTKGVPLVRSGDYVKKGSTLISGKITLYENVKGLVPAAGEVYGNIWYNAEISMPRTEEIETKTGNERYNFNINNRILRKNKYQYFKQENIKEIKIFWLKIKIYKEIEYTKTTKKNEEKDALNRIKEEFDKKLAGKGEIISQKVLKKDENDSTINYRVFVITNELINEYSYIEESDLNDTNQSN